MRFTSTLELDERGQGYAVVPEPFDELFTEDAESVVTGWANEAPFQAHLTEEDGRIAVPLDPTVRLFAGDLEPGDRVTIELEPATHTHALSVPADLLDELRDHPEAADRWDTMTPEHRLEYLDWIDDERHPETRRRRIVMAVAKLMREAGSSTTEATEDEER